MRTDNTHPQLDNNTITVSPDGYYGRQTSGRRLRRSAKLLGVLLVLTIAVTVLAPASAEAHETAGYPGHNVADVSCVPNPWGSNYGDQYDYLIQGGGIATRINPYSNPFYWDFNANTPVYGASDPQYQWVQLLLEVYQGPSFGSVYGDPIGSWDGFGGDMSVFAWNGPKQSWDSVWSTGSMRGETIILGAYPYSFATTQYPQQFWVRTWIYWDYYKDGQTGALTPSRSNWTNYGNIWHAGPWKLVTC